MKYKLVVAMGEEDGGMVELGDETNFQLKIGHRDEKYSIEKVVNDIVNIFVW